jgi:hypothetical protein
VRSTLIAVAAEIWNTLIAAAAEIWEWHPPVGVYIGILGLLAVVVPLVREKAGKKERAAWTALMFTLLLLEIKSIYQDRDEHQQQFASTLAAMKQVFNEITGGDSYVYFKIDDKLDVVYGPSETEVEDIPKGYLYIRTYLAFVGNFPLHNVAVYRHCKTLTNPLGGPHQGSSHFRLPPMARYIRRKCSHSNRLLLESHPDFRKMKPGV